MRKQNKIIISACLSLFILINALVPVSAHSATNPLFIHHEGKYNYCPVGVQTDIGTYVAYCTNVQSNAIQDNIGIRSVKTKKECYVENIILSPTENAWDSQNVCDPSIIGGSFSYNGTKYSYLMAYLGCDTTDCQKNQIGFAVSNSLASGWIKCDAINPVVSHSYDDSHPKLFQWGVGQPSLINLDGKGNILLFYTSGTCYETCTYVTAINVSNLNNMERKGTAKVSNAGLNDFLSNGDFAFDEEYLYVACDLHPFSEGVLENISNFEPIYRMKVKNRNDINFYSNGVWEIVTKIGGETTGHVKNHNGGFVRDIYGNLTENSTVLVTVADEKEDWISSLWSYTINTINFK